jgi:uncharacterized membrane protein
VLHLRAVCPVDLTDRALAVLKEHAGVTHVVLLRGAAIEPAGDVLEADLAREAADEVVASHARWASTARAALALAIGFPLAMLVTAGVAVQGPVSGLFDRNRVLAGHQVGFVSQVGPFSLIVALLAGAAGMLSMTSAKSAALVGVFISVTTVPAAGCAAVAAILGEWELFAHSAGQLAVNLVGIVVAAALVSAVRSRKNRAKDPGRPLSQG